MAALNGWRDRQAVIAPCTGEAAVCYITPRSRRLAFRRSESAPDAESTCDLRQIVPDAPVGLAFACFEVVLPWLVGAGRIARQSWRGKSTATWAKPTASTRWATTKGSCP